MSIKSNHNNQYKNNNSLLSNSKLPLRINHNYKKLPNNQNNQNNKTFNKNINKIINKNLHSLNPSHKKSNRQSNTPKYTSFKNMIKWNSYCSKSKEKCKSYKYPWLIISNGKSIKLMQHHPLESKLKELLFKSGMKELYKLTSLTYVLWSISANCINNGFPSVLALRPSQSPVHCKKSYLWTLKYLFSHKDMLIYME